MTKFSLLAVTRKASAKNRMSMPNPPAINMLWIGGPLPWYAEASIRSFIHHGHEVNLYTYETDLRPPVACRIIDARDVLPRSEVFAYRDGQYQGYLSGFANWFRYELLYRNGGWWADTDVICARQFRADGDYVFASCWEPSVFDFVNNNVIFVRERGNALMKSCAAICAEKKSNVEHSETGPTLLNSMVRRSNLTRFITSPRVFNPIHYSDLKLLFSPASTIRLYSLGRRLRRLKPIYLDSGVHGVHLYSAILVRTLGARDFSAVPRTSYLWRLLIENGALPRAETGHRLPA